jgi:hypothetical protein
MTIGAPCILARPLYHDDPLLVHAATAISQPVHERRPQCHGAGRRCATAAAMAATIVSVVTPPAIFAWFNPG